MIKKETINNKEMTIDCDGYEQLEITIPKTVDELLYIKLENKHNTIVNIIYEGTILEWHKIKKGLISSTTIKEDWYGYYYHNAPIQETTKESYINWINMPSLFIACNDGVVLDDCEQNKNNPVEIKYSSYWKD